MTAVHEHGDVRVQVDLFGRGRWHLLASLGYLEHLERPPFLLMSPRRHLSLFRPSYQLATSSRRPQGIRPS